MRRLGMRKFLVTAFAVAGIVLLTYSNSLAQGKMKQINIQAQAMGEAQQLGRNFNITLYIFEFSPSGDQTILLDAFKAKGNEGLVNALSKMKAKGRLAITGTLGYDVNYIRQWSMPDGSTKYRIVMDRPIAFGEAWSDSRSMDYNLAAMEIILATDKKKSSGTLFPRCQLTIDKDNQVQADLFQNPWKLVNIMKR